MKTTVAGVSEANRKDFFEGHFFDIRADNHHFSCSRRSLRINRQYQGKHAIEESIYGVRSQKDWRSFARGMTFVHRGLVFVHRGLWCSFLIGDAFALIRRLLARKCDEESCPQRRPLFASYLGQKRKRRPGFIIFTSCAVICIRERDAAATILVSEKRHSR